jgi:hypothetical protein
MMTTQSIKHGYQKEFSRHVSPADRKRGVAGYTRDVERCPVTGKLTNCLYYSLSGRLVAVYDQDAANQLT